MTSTGMAYAYKPMPEADIFLQTAESGDVKSFKELVENSHRHSIEYWIRKMICDPMSDYPKIELYNEYYFDYANYVQYMHMGKSVLHFAARGGNVEMVKYLIDNGAEVNLPDSFGQTPLYEAAVHNHIDALKYLIKKGAEVNVIDRLRHQPIHGAARAGHLEIVKYLHSQGNDIDARDIYQQTPLHKAASTGKMDVVKYLIRNGASVRTKDRYDVTPLHSAVYNRQYDMVPFLIKMGADVNAKDKACEERVKKIYYTTKTIPDSIPISITYFYSGEFPAITPLLLSLKLDDIPMTKILLQKGANVELGEFAKLIKDKNYDLATLILQNSSSIRNKLIIPAGILLALFFIAVNFFRRKRGNEKNV